ncbi:MAG: efflux RND transporter permease subunit [Deltaproteobacteria bacterium]|nr:efflux RND transporter permease subunit [Deltaproteobacteria bacterium]
MIRRIIELSLRRRWFVLGAAAVLLAAGGWRAVVMPVDVFPDLTAPQVTVVTEAEGMAPQEMEQLITFPIETAVNGVAGVRRVRSASAAGISIVWVEFDWSTPGAVARQRVTERLQAATGSLPPEASPPTLAPASSVMGEIAFIALTSERASPMDLRRISEVEVRRRLLAVPGVSQVVPLGGEERQFQVQLDPESLERHRLTIGEVAEAVERGSHNAPGGFLVERGQESVVRILGRARTVEDLARIAVAVRGGSPVRLGQLGQVIEGAAVQRGTASYRGVPAVVMSIQKQPGADTIAVTAAIDEALDALQPDLSRRGIELRRDIFRQAAFIRTSIDNLMVVLRDGAVLVVLVLLLFLWSVRATLISVLAIPLSVLASVVVLDLLGMTLDTMTLGGIAIAVGALVDDAIIGVENVVRRLRERSGLPEPERPPVVDTVLRAIQEIVSSIVSATLIIILVFLPLFFLEGIEGRLLRPLATSYVVAIFASLVVAITVTPALCLTLLPRTRLVSRGKEPPSVRALLRGYEPTLRQAQRRPHAVAAIAFLVLAASVLAFVPLGRSFLPEFNEGSLNVAVVTLPGTSLEQSDALGRMVEEALLADPAIASTARRTGRAERDEHVQGVEAAELEVMLRPDERPKEELLRDLRARLATVPGVQCTIGQPISHRIDHMVSGQRAALVIRVVGDDLRVLRRVAGEVKSAAEGTVGLVDLSVEQIVDVPETVVRVSSAAAARYGMSSGEAARAVGTALWGHTAGRIYEGPVVTDVVVRYGTDVLRDREALARVRLPTPAGVLVPLTELADVREERGPNYVMRENVERRVVVTANVAGRDLRSVFDEVRRRVRKAVRPPSGVRIEYSGQFEREEAAGRRLLLLGALAILGIAVIVGATLRSTRRTLIVLTNLPLALAGGVAGVWLASGVLSVASMIGFITLFGIATRNGIMLATHANHLEAEGLPWREAVATSARQRLAPILMTAICAGLGLVPLALAAGEPGSEIQAPMAIVILCGLATSTALNMVVVPSLLTRWGGSPAAR